MSSCCDFQGATKAFERSIRSHPTNSAVALGKIHEASEQLDKAKEVSQSAILLESSPTVWVVLGEVFVREGNRPKAIHAFQRAEYYLVCNHFYDFYINWKG